MTHRPQLEPPGLPQVMLGHFGTRCFVLLCSLQLGICLFAYSLCAAQALSDRTLANLTFEQKLGSKISMDLPFCDETGTRVRLRKYFAQKPVILVLGYYECPMLCTLVLNGMVEALQDLKWSIGNEFEVINVSISPSETPRLALAKKLSYLKRYGRSEAAEGWHFLTGDQSSIEQLAAEVGFQYAYDASSKQFAHPSGLVILTAQGQVSSYRLGVTFSPKDLYSSLQTASSKGIGSYVQNLILLCFHYNPITGKYGPVVILSVRLLGAATILGLAWLVLGMARHERTLTRMRLGVQDSVNGTPLQRRSLGVEQPSNVVAVAESTLIPPKRT